MHTPGLILVVSRSIESRESWIMTEIARGATKAIALFPPSAVDLCRREVLTRRRLRLHTRVLMIYDRLVRMEIC